MVHYCSLSAHIPFLGHLDSEVKRTFINGLKDTRENIWLGVIYIETKLGKKEGYKK